VVLLEEEYLSILIKNKQIFTNDVPASHLVYNELTRSMKEYPCGITTDEYLDLVDKNDKIIGRKPRSAIYQERLSNFRVVNAFVVNSKGQLWIPQRSHDKKKFPGALDFSMGGHVESGESYDIAFKRETLEELRIDIAAINYRLLGKLSPKRDRVASFMQVYEILMEQTPKYNPDDFINSYWLYSHELQAMIKNGKPAKSDLIVVTNRFYKDR